MNIFTKSVAALISLVAFQSAAMAQTLSPANTAVTASGQLTQDLNGTLTTVCNVTLSGTTDSTGITFTSYTGSAVSGPLACDDGLVLPLRVQANSSTSVTIKDMAVSTRLGDCGPRDVVGPWSNLTSTAGPLSAALPGTTGFLALIGGVCNASGSLTVSPAVTIN
ncbi:MULTISPECIES: hypothetical protein [unclassified Sphingomonas]|jgi:hypothetical protein|uniref:hypothetical protein n=1 Tax=unclassified Sphingomonas TaxID=196159 RepID=UPI000A996AF9|nr:MULTISPECIES: hypothetical protein [unclassified Sphingomonas]